MYKKTNQINNEINRNITTIDTLKTEISSATTEKLRIEKGIISEKESLDRIRVDINNGTKELETVQAKKDAHLDSIKEFRLEAEKNKETLKSQKYKIDDFTDKIAASQTELLVLQDQINKAKADINITTLDIKGFSGESKDQINKYFWLAMISISFLAGIFFYMFNNAQTFSDLIDANPTAPVWKILLSRLPLITATTLIIGTLSALLFYLVNNIVNISNDKMNMLKASILAEQITGSLPKHDMTEEEIRDYKRNTKIELVMNIFANKSEVIKEAKLSEAIKQLADIMKSKK